MGKLVAFGELLLRLNTPELQRFSQAGQFDISFAGAEANVAVACASLGQSATFVTALPDNDIADTALRQLSYWNVDTSHVQRTGKRIGVYYLESGFGSRPSSVIYDRENSAFALTSPESYDWLALLEGADWLHLTGITPALSPAHRNALPQIARQARERGVKVSFDLNYRSKLCSLAEARAFCEPILLASDLLIASVHQVEPVLGIFIGGKSREEALRAAIDLREMTGAAQVVLTSRETLANGSERRWAIGVSADEEAASRDFDYQILDPLGGGDAFDGALLSRLMKGDLLGDSLDFAVAAAALKYSHRGDYLRVSEAEIHRLVASPTTGGVAR